MHNLRVLHKLKSTSKMIKEEKTISSIQFHDITKSCTDATASSKHDLYRGADKSLARRGRKFWVLYILFIIIIEGILLLFIYIKRLEPNDLSTPLLVIRWLLQVYIKGDSQFSFRITHKSMAANGSENFELLDKTAYKYFSLDFVSPLLLKSEMIYQNMAIQQMKTSLQCKLKRK